MRPITNLEKGTVVQLGPNTPNKVFAYCFMVVTEPKAWGAQGYVQMLGDGEGGVGGRAYYRAIWEDMDIVGKTVWLADDGLEGSD